MTVAAVFAVFENIKVWWQAAVFILFIFYIILADIQYLYILLVKYTLLSSS
jgi:hypothetical protein